MSVRTYNPSVRVGNWNEDICLEEVRNNKSQAKEINISFTITGSSQRLLAQKGNWSIVYTENSQSATNTT